MWDWSIFGLVVAIGVSAVCNGIFTDMMTSYLSKHGIKSNLLTFRYLKQYRKLTLEENGKPGNLFYAWIVSTSIYFVSLVVVIILTITSNG